MRMIKNKSDLKYCSYYSIQISESKPIKAPSRKCVELRERIVKNLEGVFKEVLEKGDRMNIPPIKISLREGSVPYYNAGAFDTP